MTPMKKYKNYCFKGVLYRRCWMCSNILTRTTATVDHLIATSEGGGDDWDNLRLACFPCNNRRKNNPLTDEDRAKLEAHDKDYDTVIARPRRDFTKLAESIQRNRINGSDQADQ